MKKILKWILIVFFVLIVGLFIASKVMSKTVPVGESGASAEALTDKILNRINKPAWDSLNYISWTFFRGQNHYVWDKQNNISNVTWADNEVILNLEDYYNKSIAKKSSNILEGEEKIKSIQAAWTMWCNDSFWLYAPYKIRDQGVKRSHVKEGGKEGLLITYESGGVTPGDSYLWWVDNTGLPESFDMWTSIIPVKGVNATWTDWEKVNKGAMIAKTHKIGPMEMSISNLKSGPTLKSIDVDESIFK